MSSVARVEEIDGVSGNQIRRTRILFLEHNTDSTVGGSHYCLLEICRALDRSRFKAVVWFYEKNVLEDDFREAGAEVIVAPPLPPHLFAQSVKSIFLRVPARLAQRLANAYSMLLRRVRTWRSVLREWDIDVVHLNNSCAYDQDLALAARLEGKACIAHQRGMAPHVGVFARWVARRMDRVIAISTAVRRDLSRQEIPSLLIHDAIDPNRVAITKTSIALRESLRILPGAPVIGIVGNIKRWKGQLTVVQAMLEISKRFPDAHCLLVGAVADERYHAELVEFTRNSGLGGQVHFLGFQRDPWNWMGVMDVVLHASVEPEPFGIVLLEAMALSKPVVATDCGGPIDIVEDGETGFRVSPGDAEALTSRVCLLLEQRSLCAKFGVAGRARLERLFTIRQQIRKLECLYDALADR